MDLAVAAGLLAIALSCLPACSARGSRVNSWVIEFHDYRVQIRRPGERVASDLATRYLGASAGGAWINLKYCIDHSYEVTAIDRADHSIAAARFLAYYNATPEPLRIPGWAKGPGVVVGLAPHRAAAVYVDHRRAPFAELGRVFVAETPSRDVTNAHVIVKDIDGGETELVEPSGGICS